MSRLYLRCIICSRQQAEGLISGAAWGRLELPLGAALEQPAQQGTTLRACPRCIADHPDWQTRILARFGLPHGHGAAHPEPSGS